MRTIWVRVLKNNPTMCDRTSLTEKTGVEHVPVLFGSGVLKNDHTMCDRGLLTAKTGVWSACSTACAIWNSGYVSARTIWVRV